MDTETEDITETKQPKRKTLDDILGISGLLIVAIIGSFSYVMPENNILGIIGGIGSITGLVAIYKLIKNRKELSGRHKWIGWVLVAVWLVTFSFFY